MHKIYISGKKNKGKYTCVDVDDYEMLMGMGKWLITKGSRDTAQPYVGRYDMKTKKWIFMHRIILGVSKGEYVDHINNNTLDNRKENLRVATNRMNQYNQRRRKNSKYMRGVTFDKSAVNKPWKAQIKVNGVNKHIGMFKTEQEAHNAYRSVLNEVAGEYSPYMDQLLASAA